MLQIFVSFPVVSPHGGRRSTEFPERSPEVHRIGQKLNW